MSGSDTDDLTHRALTGNEACTSLRYSESAFGRIDEATMANKEHGWRYLLACLRAHVEGSEPPAWVEG